MMFGMGFGPLFGIIALLLIGWGIFNVFTTNRVQNRPFSAGADYRTEADALTILKQRYARGEISISEYERMRQDISDL